MGGSEFLRRLQPLKADMEAAYFRVYQPFHVREEDFDALLREPLDGTDVTLDISLGDGPGAARLLASDLSHAYVSLNADYRS